MLDAMGMNLFTMYNPTPTRINRTTMFNNGIFSCSC
jgi:hypothetical protein